MALVLLSGCGRNARKEPDGINPTHPPLILDPPAAEPAPAIEPEPQPPVIAIDENPKARLYIFWLMDRADGLFQHGDDTIRESWLTLAEALALGVPQEVWFFSQANPEATVIFMATRRLKS